MSAHDAGETSSGAQLQNPHALQSRTVRLVEVVGQQDLRVPNDRAHVSNVLSCACSGKVACGLGIILSCWGGDRDEGVLHQCLRTTNATVEYSRRYIPSNGRALRMYQPTSPAVRGYHPSQCSKSGTSPIVRVERCEGEKESRRDAMLRAYDVQTLHSKPVAGRPTTVANLFDKDCSRLLEVESSLRKH